jgi:general secretion pathway protein E
MDGIEEVVGLDEAAKDLTDNADLLSGDDDAPVIKLLNAVFFEALREKASDIHIEPYENEARIRFRLDGALRTVLSPPATIAPLIISRIKVLAKLDIAEKRVPQDGRMTVHLGGRAVDLRVSTMPSSYGERVVLRLMDKNAGQLNVDDLGMDVNNRSKLDSMIARPHGIILVTGPTGSGKTTTLYAALQQMDRQQRNIMTVEDPIEYDLPGVSQTQINQRAGMTFAKSLRAILRQDPDVILIGEIRDKETAEIAIQASLTGHLVLSTLHTNTAAGAVTRLQDLGIDSYLLASTLRGVLAQRLVRKLCDDCKVEEASSA